jgi:NAD(P)-dependent dehydrogenase (short-subunit alcohol dehydrogenase family)
LNSAYSKEMTMRDKPVALVTGANQGIGLQIAKDLVAHGLTVLVGSRNLERGVAAAKEVGPASPAMSPSMRLCGWPVRSPRASISLNSGSAASARLGIWRRRAFAAWRHCG